MANFLVWVVWFFAAFACLASALGVVSFRNPFYSALSLIGNLGALAMAKIAAMKNSTSASTTATLPPPAAVCARSTPPTASPW